MPLYKLRLKLHRMARPGGYAVLAGTPTDLRRGLGLTIAQFGESVTPTLYQSPKDAKRRAELLIWALKYGSTNVEFE